MAGAGARWAAAAYGVSGMYSLLRNGQIVPGLPAAPNPYTAVGVKADGTALSFRITVRADSSSTTSTVSAPVWPAEMV